MPVRDDEVVLCADTTVALGPPDHGQTGRCGRGGCSFLLALSGRATGDHGGGGANGRQIWRTRRGHNRQDETPVDVELNCYLATADWQGKAGGYGIQGPAAFHPLDQGSFHAVMGLPVAETAALAAAAGYPVFGEQP